MSRCERISLQQAVDEFLAVKASRGDIAFGVHGEFKKSDTEPPFTKDMASDLLCARDLVLRLQILTEAELERLELFPNLRPEDIHILRTTKPIELNPNALSPDLRAQHAEAQSLLRVASSTFREITELLLGKQADQLLYEARATKRQSPAVTRHAKAINKAARFLTKAQTASAQPMGDIFGEEVGNRALNGSDKVLDMGTIRFGNISHFCQELRDFAQELRRCT